MLLLAMSIFLSCVIGAHAEATLQSNLYYEMGHAFEFFRFV